MAHVPPGTEVMTTGECWSSLATTSVGRLAVNVAGRPDIFPINYVVDGHCLMFRTAAGTKFVAAAIVHDVAFEIDGYDPTERTAWSVVVKGRAHEVENMDDLFATEDLPLFPWAAHPKPIFVRIDPTEVTGRRFRVLDGVAPDASIGWEPQPVARSSDAVVPEPGAAYHPGEPKMRPG